MNKIALVISLICAGPTFLGAGSVVPVMDLAVPGQVILHGQLGKAVDASYQGRLKRFIQDTKSKPIAIFSPEAVAKNFAGDWNGEHAGKWMYTAARAASRTHDVELAATVRNVADYLVSLQESSGYLGTYAPTAKSRMTSPDVADTRTWDVWVHSYIILGLLEVNRFFPNEQYLQAASRVGDLCYDIFVRGGVSTADQGNHVGLSGTILLEPAIALYRATGRAKYLELANRSVDQFEARSALAMASRSNKGIDLQLMARSISSCGTLSALPSSTRRRGGRSICLQPSMPRATSSMTVLRPVEDRGEVSLDISKSLTRRATSTPTEWWKRATPCRGSNSIAIFCG